MMLPLILSMSLGCSASLSPAPAARTAEVGGAEMDLPQQDGSWTLDAEASLAVVDGVLRTVGLDGLEGELVGEPAIADHGLRAVLALRPPDRFETQLVVLERTREGWRDRVLLDGPGMPDRPAISPDGRTVAFVWAGPTGGVAGIWSVPFAGGKPERLTNHDVRHSKDHGWPPPDFTPLPSEGAPWFEGSTLHWNAEDGAHSVEVTR